MRALEADLWTRQGLVEGTGPWAGLMNHPRRDELVENIRQATEGYAFTNAREWTLLPFEYPDHRLQRRHAQVGRGLRRAARGAPLAQRAHGEGPGPASSHRAVKYAGPAAQPLPRLGGFEPQRYLADPPIDQMLQ